MNQPLAELRLRMAERGIDAYLVEASDFHQSEYFCAYFDATRFLSHFTGESCTLVITAGEAMLWTDGRFFLQAEEQMDPEFTLCRMGMPDVPTVEEYLKDVLPDGGTLGFDGRIVSAREEKALREALQGKDIRFAWEEDLVGMVWPERPALTREPVTLYDVSFAGRSAKEKLSDLRASMRQSGADVHVLSTLDDIAWLFNIRGNDIPDSPVALAYALITLEDAVLFVQEGTAGEEVRENLAEAGVRIRDYGEIFEAVASLPAGSRVLMDGQKVNMALLGKLPSSCEWINAANPTTHMKAVKNEVEIRRTTDCHIRDGAAMVKFIYWLKTHIGREEMTELSVSEKLQEFRDEQDLSRGPSFDTIAAYGPHAAVIHYMPTPETNIPLKPEGFLLLDSGGQYLDGTTDITRTIALGPLTDEQKHYFTVTLRSMLALMDAKFTTDCVGPNLEILARAPIWELGLDYRHGTGHGVGHYLCVHEGPQGFRLKPRGDSVSTFEPGMITTDEPGIYLDYQYGIRLENELLCVRAEKTEYGQFLRFQNLTFCPIDLDAVDPNGLSPKETALLNDYHALVYETLKDRLSPEEAAWLREATRAV